MRRNSNGQEVTTVTDLKNLIKASVKPNNYKVELSVDTSDGEFTSSQFNILVKSTTMPERRINPTEVWYRGRKLVLRSEQENAGDWECTVIDTSEMALRKAMSDWFERVDSLRRTMDARNSYMVSAKVFQLDVQGNPIFGVQLNHVFISSIGSISFDDSSNDQLTEFSLTFSYSEIQQLNAGENNSGVIKVTNPNVRSEPTVSSNNRLYRRNQMQFL
jgi:hypothetical protein